MVVVLLGRSFWQPMMLHTVHAFHAAMSRDWYWDSESSPSTYDIYTFSTMTYWCWQISIHSCEKYSVFQMRIPRLLKKQIEHVLVLATFDVGNIRYCSRQSALSSRTRTVQSGPIWQSYKHAINSLTRVSMECFKPMAGNLWSMETIWTCRASTAYTIWTYVHEYHSFWVRDTCAESAVQYRSIYTCCGKEWCISGNQWWNVLFIIQLVTMSWFR